MSHELPLPVHTGLVRVPWVVPFHDGHLVPMLLSDDDEENSLLAVGGAALLSRVGVDGGLLLLAPGLMVVGGG